MNNASFIPPITIRKDWPKISIVTPSLNQAGFIEETIRSVLLQGYPNLEYIIIDGGSTDGSVEIIKKYEPWLTYWVSEPDQGQSQAINKGISRCTGEIFGFINSDDFYYDFSLFTVAKNYQSSNDKKHFWLCGRVNIVDEESKIIRPIESRFSENPLGWYFHRIFNPGTSIIQQGAFWSTNLFSQIGMFDEGLSYSFDYDFFIRLYNSNISIKTSDQIIAAYRHHQTSKTKSHSTFFVEEDYKIAQKYAHEYSTQEYQNLLQQMSLMADRATLTRIVEAENSPFTLIKQITPLILRHPRLLLLRRTYRWVKLFFKNNLVGLIV